jgi:hypothetical protein
MGARVTGSNFTRCLVLAFERGCATGDSVVREPWVETAEEAEGNGGGR